jgi:hypothetical protein
VGKLRLVGVNDTTGSATPVPFKFSLMGLVAGSESKINNDPFRLPGAAGEKVTVNLQLFPTARLDPQVLV